MCQTAANLVEHVLPAGPLRQWVLTVPYELRGRLGFDGKVLGAVARIFVDSILGWLRVLPRLSTTDVADALQVARARIPGHLERRGVIQIDADADVLCVDDALAEREPALAQLASCGRTVAPDFCRIEEPARWPPRSW